MCCKSSGRNFFSSKNARCDGTYRNRPGCWWIGDDEIGRGTQRRDAVYRNRRRIRGPRGLRLLRLRGERLERPFAHLYQTGRMRRHAARPPRTRQRHRGRSCGPHSLDLAAGEASSTPRTTDFIAGAAFDREVPYRAPQPERNGFHHGLPAVAQGKIPYQTHAQRPKNWTATTGQGSEAD